MRRLTRAHGPRPAPSPWAASFPPQILVYHPAFIKYVFDSWLQGHGRYPSTGILSVIFSLHVCDEVGHTPSPSPAASCSPGGGQGACGQGLHPHPQASSGSSGPVSTVGLAVPPPRTFQERAVFSWRGSCSGQGQAQQVEAQTGG